MFLCCNGFAERGSAYYRDGWWTQRFWFSHTKTKEERRRAWSNVPPRTWWLHAGLPIPAIPIFCLLRPLFQAFKSCPSFHCCTIPPFLFPSPRPVRFSTKEEREDGNKRKHQPCRILRREWPFATNANSSSRNLRRRGASASSCSRSTRRCSRWWWTGWGSLMRAMMILQPACLLMSAATRCLILTGSLMRTAKRARSSSSLGLLTYQKLGARCCTRAPRTASRGSSTVSRWSYRRPTRAR